MKILNSKIQRQRLSFRHAFAGLKELWTNERNARVHMAATLLVVICGFVFRVSAAEWCVLLLTVGAVWSAEAMNSAVERVVDLAADGKILPLAKAAKDLAAAAVLIFAIASVPIGLIIFLPKLITFLSSCF